MRIWPAFSAPPERIVRKRDEMGMSEIHIPVIIGVVVPGCQ